MKSSGLYFEIGRLFRPWYGVHDHLGMVSGSEEVVTNKGTNHLRSDGLYEFLVTRMAIHAELVPSIHHVHPVSVFAQVGIGIFQKSLLHLCQHVSIDILCGLLESLFEQAFSQFSLVGVARAHTRDSEDTTRSVVIDISRRLHCV